MTTTAPLNGRINKDPLPAALESEAQVVATLLFDSNLIDQATQSLASCDFLEETNRQAFSELVAMRREGEPITERQLCQRLRQNTAVGESSAIYLAELARHFGGTSAHLPFHLMQVAAASRRRQLATALRAATIEVQKGADASRVVRDLRRTLDDFTRRSNENGFTRITSAELAKSDYSLEYLIDGALVAGQPLIIGGPQKSLKTSIIIDAAISLSTGGRLLGYLPVNRTCRVAVMTGESGLATIQETAIRIAAAAGKFLEELDNLVWSPDLPRFGDLDHMDSLERFLKQDDIEVLFIDPAYLCMPSSDAGNIMAQGELLRGMSQVCDDAGAMICLAHHAKRNTGRDRYAPTELRDLSWAGFAEFARQWWLVNRREAYKPGTGDHKLWLNVGGSAGHSGLWSVDVTEGVRSEFEARKWDVSVMSGDEARTSAAETADQRREQQRYEKDAAQLKRDRRAVVDALADQQPQSKTSIRDKARIRGPRLEGVLEALLDEGVIEGCIFTIPSNHKQCDGYRLAQQRGSF